VRVLLIGGNGFIGRPLTHQLQRAGHEIAVFHRRSSRTDMASDILQIQGDRNRLSGYRDRIRRFAPDVIVDFILSSGDQARELMSVVSGITNRVIAISSGDVYRAWGVLHGIESGPLESVPIREDSALRTTRRLYPPETISMMRSIAAWATEDYDKIAVEEAIMSGRDVSGSVLRLPMVYGPEDRANRLFPILKPIADGRPSIILPENFAGWRGPRGYVENVAHAVALAIMSDRAAGCIFNVCEEPSVSELEWRTAVGRQAGWTGKFVVLPVMRTPRHLLFPLNAAQHVVLSSERIRTQLGYNEIVSWDEGIRRTIAWERATPAKNVNLQPSDYAAEDAALASVV
jgi:nucleoside-diphosphate-sugar epimerase